MRMNAVHWKGWIIMIIIPIMDSSYGVPILLQNKNSAHTIQAHIHIICGHRNGLPAFCEKAYLRRKVLSLVLNSEWDYFADQQAANSRQMEQQN